MAGPRAYQRVGNTTANPADYDWQPFPKYLSFDGIDDHLATPSIDFSNTDKMTVWAGVRKLSDAAAGVLLELSAAYGANAGSFGLFAPGIAAAPTYDFVSRGTGTSTAAIASAVPSPITSILAAQGSIAGDLRSLRINGALAATNSADQGTGNYGNYPLYIGRRGGTTLPFNGYLYGLIIRGALSTDAQIRSAERYLAQRTGVQLS